MTTDKRTTGLEAALGVLSGKWKPAILSAIGDGPLRFGELRRRVVGITEKMLIVSLREMRSQGIVEKKDFGQVPLKVEYSLTRRGALLLASLTALCEWGDEHVEWGRGVESVVEGRGR